MKHEKIKQSLQDKHVLINLGNWHVRARKAFDNKYYLETITICFNSINLILRFCIYHKNPSIYVKELFTNFNNPLMGAINERLVYNEAKRIGVLSNKHKLHALHEERNKFMHKLLKNSESSPVLRKLAKNYLLATEECLLELASILAGRFVTESQKSNLLDFAECTKLYKNLKDMMNHKFI